MKVDIKAGEGYISIKELVRSCGGELCFESAGAEERIRSICTDSREVSAGALFVAIVGERVDGHDFIEIAIKNGAVAVLAERRVEFSGNEARIPLIIVKDTVAALSDIARVLGSRTDAVRIAVTGSVGKTTTKEFISRVLERDGKVYHTKGNYNSVIGMPLSMAEIENDDRYAVLEMGMSGLGEIESMSLAARPRVAVITNIGSSHLEYLKTRENIARAKLEIRAGLEADGYLLLNGDEPLLSGIEVEHARVIYFSALGNERADCRITNYRELDDGCVFDMRLSGVEWTDVRLSVGGRHNAQAALIAATVGCIFGMSEASIREGLLSFAPVAMRQNFISAGGLHVLEDCYNAGPESMRAAIDVLIPAAERMGGRPAAILGDMGELGETSPELHRSVGEYFAQKGGAWLLAFGPRAEAMADGAAAAGLSADRIMKIKDITALDAPRLAAEAAKHALTQKDLLLIKASRAVKAERIVEALDVLDK